MKTTSSYSSLAFAAFFKGKKAAKQLRQRNRKTVKENGENWLLDTVNWQLPDGGGGGGVRQAGGTASETRAICKCHTFCQSIKMMSQCMKNT